MLKNNSLAGTALALSCFLSQPVIAVEAPVSADVHNSPGMVNFGGSYFFNVDAISTSYLAFDLSTLPVGVTGAKIAKASLLVWVNKTSGVGALDVLPVTSAWTERGVMSSAAPSTGSAVARSPVLAGAQYAVVDVTALVQNWVDYPSQNFGLALVPSADHATTSASFDSKENTNTSHAPKLEIVLISDGTPGESGPMGPAGPVGATGPQGEAGAKGDKGDSGVMVVPIAAKNSVCNGDVDTISITLDRRTLLTCQAGLWAQQTIPSAIVGYGKYVGGAANSCVAYAPPIRCDGAADVTAYPHSTTIDPQPPVCSSGYQIAQLGQAGTTSFYACYSN